MLSGHASSTSVVVVTLTFINLAILFVLFRIYARLRIARNAGLDDVFISLALVFAIGTTATFIIQAKNGSGRHQDTISQYEGIVQGKAFYVSVILYNLSLPMSKLSILLQYLRIFPQKRFRIACIVVLCLVSAYASFAVLTAIFACNPIPFFWDHTLQGRCLPRFPIWFANSAFNIASDITIALMPLPVLNQLELPNRTKRALQLVFALGGCGCLVSVLRFQSLYVISRTEDVSYNNPMAAIWSDLEMNIAIMCSCLPTLRCLFPRLLKNHRSVPRNDSRATGAANEDEAGCKPKLASMLPKRGSKNGASTDASQLSSTSRGMGQKQGTRITTTRTTSDIRTMSSFDDIEFGRMEHSLPNGRIHVLTAIEQEVEKRTGAGNGADSMTGWTRDGTAYRLRDGRCEGA